MNRQTMEEKSLLKLLLGIGAIITTIFLSSPSPVHAQAAQDCFYNACSVGPICDLGPQFYSPGDFVYNQELSFPVGELKIIPQPYYEEYKDFVCKADECDSAYGDTWYCTSAIIGGTNVNRIQQCPNFRRLASICSLEPCTGASSLCESGAVRYCSSIGAYRRCIGGSWASTPFVDEFGKCSNAPCPLSSCTGETGACNSGAVRYCNVNGSYQMCTSTGWASTPFVDEFGTCFTAEDEIPWMYCIGGELGVPGSGRWQDTAFEFESGRCEDLLVELTAGMTPGYVKTYTPHLFDIWKNTVASTQAIFSIFRTQLGKPVYDWPGESTIVYNFTPYEGTGFATAGFPPMIHAGWDAKIYFRYLGYIHCAKENLLQKLSSLFYDPPYVYYDARCDSELW